jgi:hypothetical protein
MPMRLLSRALDMAEYSAHASCLMDERSRATTANAMQVTSLSLRAICANGSEKAPAPVGGYGAGACSS